MNSPKEISKWPDPLRSREHYFVPQDYFDNLNERIMSRIEKECAQERVQKPNLRLWSYLRPVLYMAASFLIVIAGFKLLEWQTGRVKSLPIAEQPVTQNDLSIETEAYYDFLTEDDYLARAYLPEDAF